MYIVRALLFFYSNIYAKEGVGLVSYPYPYKRINIKISNKNNFKGYFNQHII